MICCRLTNRDDGRKNDIRYFRSAFYGACGAAAERSAADSRYMIYADFANLYKLFVNKITKNGETAGQRTLCRSGTGTRKKYVPGFRILRKTGTLFTKARGDVCVTLCRLIILRYETALSFYFTGISRIQPSGASRWPI